MSAPDQRRAPPVPPPPPAPASDPPLSEALETELAALEAILPSNPPPPAPSDDAEHAPESSDAPGAP